MSDRRVEIFNKVAVKPPLGVMPREIYNRLTAKERLGALLQAVQRYVDADIKIPEEWMDEISDLVDRHNIKADEVNVLCK